MHTGETAKQIFERARLPNEILGRIWNLADTKQRGALDATEFIIAMHLLTSYKSGAMRGIPQTLPPGLYEAASRRGSARSSMGSRSGYDIPPLPSIQKQFTGPQRTQSPINRQQFGSPLSAQSTGGDWLVTPQEKAQFDSIFASIDTAKAGLISGDQAVAFFMNAQLPEETLAQIWDLADIDADGQLTRDEFAVAMHLVRLVRAGKEPLPQTLPPALIPPSMRRRPPVVPTPAAVPAPAPAAAPAPAPTPRSAAEDLFGLDAFTAPPPAAPSQVPQSTGGSNAPFPMPGSPSSRASAPSPTTTFKPFVPTSSFGQSLQPQFTGQARPAAAKSPPPPSEDLLGDNDPEESNKLTQDTADLANLSNQIGSLAKEMHTVQEKRTTAEHDLSQTAQQKRDFEARLAQARAMYDQEVKNFKALEERLKASRAETGKLQQEYALLDGSRQDLQNQYNQVSAALAADQHENASLKEKIRKANAEIAQLKPALEKARSEARQQKGLAAINKKQLATVEAERDKIQGEIDTISEENQEPEESAAPVVVTSPAASTTSQNTNPFFRRTNTGSSDYALSPVGSNEQQRAFDNLFGPTFASPTTSVTPPPPTSFRAESPSVQQVQSKSPVTPGVPTPSVSPPPPNSGAFSEPPSLSQSRQITPSFLPFGESQSGTTSTMVSPPASRAGAPEASTVEAPAQAVSGGATTAQSQPSHETATAQSPFDETQESKAPSPEVPVAATPDQSAAAVPTTGNEKQDPAKDPSFDELFGDRARERSQSQKANDFEEAFAAMKHSTGNSQANGNAAAADTEFPPIRELDNDDDDSTDSEAPMGFDDNFTPLSPPRTHEQPNAESIDPAQLEAFPAPGTTTARSPPPPDAQHSPPKYDESVPKQESAFPPEFNGLLPSRTDPTALPDAPHSVESSTDAPVVGGEPRKDASKDLTAATNAKKTAAPDFEAAFAGLDLAPAKEADDDDDDESESDDNNKNPADFSFSFDSPPQSKPAPATSNHGQVPSSDLFSFNDNVNASSAQTISSKPATSPAETNSKATTHDWDAIFAPLENAKTPESGANGTGNPNDKTAESGAPDKREPGWALADSGEDDFILQRLTGMGFPRDESLNALEKFDYNIDKVSLG